MPVLGDTGYQLDTCWDEAEMRTEMGTRDHRESNEHTEAFRCLMLGPQLGSLSGES